MTAFSPDMQEMHYRHESRRARFADFCAYAGINSRYERKGQRAFNALCELRPDLSAQVRGTNLDPFYTDSVLPSFYEWVGNNW